MCLVKVWDILIVGAVNCRKMDLTDVSLTKTIRVRPRFLAGRLQSLFVIPGSVLLSCHRVLHFSPT
jgi:hypothetical protein